MQRSRRTGPRDKIGLFMLSAMLTAMSFEIVAAEPEKRGPERWESQIADFERKDQQEPPAQGGILFVGSSSIRGWDLKEYFPSLPVINRGFGGSQIAGSVHFADRVILPYRPRIVVLYAGDNDINKGKSPEQVTADYQRFVRTVREALPRTKVVFISIKPSLKRWELVDQMRSANAMIKALADQDRRQEYVDIDTPMIGPDGRPREKLFKSDGLHLNADGYQLWSSQLRPFLKLE